MTKYKLSDGLPLLDVIEKKQKICESTTNECLNCFIGLVEKTLEEFNNTKDIQSVKDLVATLKKKKIVKRVTQATVEYHAAIREFGKYLDQHYNLNVDDAARYERLDPVGMKKLILLHLYREGEFEAAEALIEEAGLPADTAQDAKEGFTKMHRYLELIREGKLEEPLAWAIENREKLSKNKQPTELEFKLQRLLFLHVLQARGVPAALEYAQEHLSKFQDCFMPQIKKLMGRLLYSNRGKQDMPYSSLDHDQLLDEIAEDFNKATCRTMNMASKSELLTIAAAGSVALPQLCKLAKVSKANMSGGDFRALGGNDTMPIEIELPTEFWFHSIFACPVSKEQCLPGDNPPKMLPCGHVLGSKTIDNLASARPQGQFKCPYCPEETSKEMCRVLYFPEFD